MTAPPRQALWVRMPRFIGDGILISQALEPFRRAGIPLVAWGPERVLDLYRGSSAFAAVHPDEPRGRQVLALARALRHHRAMGVLGLTRSLRPLLAGWVARVPIRIGWADKGGHLLATHSAPFWQVDRHHFDRYQSLALSAFPGLAEAPPHRFRPRLDAEADALRLASEHGIPSGFVACALGAHGWNKRLGTAAWIQVVEGILALGGVPVLLGQGGEDADQAEAIQAAAPGTRSLVDGPGLAETAGLLRQAGALVGNDSALAHLAAAVGCPCVVAFGPTRPDWTAPRGSAEVRVVRREDLACLACGSHGCPTPGHPCMEAPPVPSLLEALRSLLPATAAITKGAP